MEETIVQLFCPYHCSTHDNPVSLSGICRSDQHFICSPRTIGVDWDPIWAEFVNPVLHTRWADGLHQGGRGGALGLLLSAYGLCSIDIDTHRCRYWITPWRKQVSRFKGENFHLSSSEQNLLLVQKYFFASIQMKFMRLMWMKNWVDYWIIKFCGCLLLVATPRILFGISRTNQ